MSKPIKRDVRAQITERLRVAPELSDRAIARSLTCSPTTVGAVRRELGVHRGQVETSKNEWLQHPYIKMHPELLGNTEERWLRAIKVPGVLDKMQAEGLSSPIYAQRKMHRQQKAARKCAAGVTISEDDILIKQGDLLSGLEFIEPESVDLILTDLPYSRDYLPLYSALSRLAGRVLREHGNLICMTGQSALPDVLRALCEDERMQYHWTLSCVMPRAASSLHWLRVSTHSKPIIHMCKGTYTGDLYSDLITAQPPDKARDIPWEQPQEVFDALCSRFIQHADTVLVDPCCGSGTSLLSGIRTGLCCRVIGVDSDPEAVKATRRRVDALLYGDGDK